MKREIKFRVWTGQQMEYNIMAGFLGAFYVQGIDDKDSASLSSFNTKYPDDPPVMQFTGLLDCNGKEIYEGDICTDKIRTYQVVYEHTGFHLLEDGLFRLDNDVEILGNIYETPELLEL